MDQKKTGSFIASLRKKKGLTQQELADRLSISNKTVSKWECGDGMPDITLLPALAAELEVTADDLLRGERSAASSAASQDSQLEDGLTYLWNAAFLRFRTSFLACLLAPPLCVAAVLFANLLFSTSVMLSTAIIAFFLSLFGSILLFFYSTHKTEQAARTFEKRCQTARRETNVFWKAKRLRLFAEIGVEIFCFLLFTAFALGRF